MPGLPRKSTVNQLKKIRRVTKGDIGDRTTKQYTRKSNLLYNRNPADRKIMSYEDFASTGNNERLKESVDVSDIERISQGGKCIVEFEDGGLFEVERLSKDSDGRDVVFTRSLTRKNMDGSPDTQPHILRLNSIKRVLTEKDYREEEFQTYEAEVTRFSEYLVECNQRGIDILRVGKWIEVGDVAGTIVKMDREGFHVSVATDDGPKTVVIPISKVAKAYRVEKGDGKQEIHLSGPYGDSKGGAPKVSKDGKGFGAEIDAKGDHEEVLSDEGKTKYGDHPGKRKNPWGGPK